MQKDAGPSRTEAGQPRSQVLRNQRGQRAHVLGALRRAVGLGGETLVIVGSRSETASFPYGFFKDWTLDANTARFRRN